MVFLILAVILYGYPTWRILAAAPWPVPTQLAVVVAVVVAAMLTPLYVVFVQRACWPRRLRDACAWVAYLLLAVAGVLFAVFLLRDTLLLLLWAAELIFLDGTTPGLSGATLHDLNVASIVLACLLTLRAVIGAHRTPGVRCVEVPVEGLPVALESLRLVQLSDLHVGPTIKRRFVARVVAAVNDLQPDVILFTGDVADGMAAELAGDVAPLAGLRCRYGPYLVTGNHEYYADPEGWMKTLQALGFEILLNEHRRIDWVSPSGESAHLLIGGLPDPAGAGCAGTPPGHTPDPAAVFAGAGPGTRLLLAHQPRDGIDAMASCRADLTLSGHTHGGQLGLWRWLVRLQQPVVAGLRYRGGGWIYVNRGAGYWGPPARLAAPSEITYLRLVRARGPAGQGGAHRRQRLFQRRR